MIEGAKRSDAHGNGGIGYTVRMTIIDDNSKLHIACDHKRRIEDVNCAECAIRHRMLFEGIDVEQAGVLLNPVKHIWFEPGDIIYRQGDDPRALYSVRNGIIKLSLLSEDGTLRIVRLMSAGSAIGLEALLGEYYQHTAEALTDADLCVLPPTTIETLGKQQPVLCKRLMGQWQRQVAQADEYLLKLSTGSIKDRVIALLQDLDRLCRDGEIVFQLPSNPDIAALVASRVESVSRIMAEFKREGVLRKEGKGGWMLTLHPSQA